MTCLSLRDPFHLPRPPRPSRLVLPALVPLRLARPQRQYDIVNAANAQAAYEQHWDSWVSDEDWQWIVKQGFNAVRLPVGVL